MSVADSLDKVVPTYFAAVTAVPFLFRGRDYRPKPLKVSPSFFNDYTCRLGCAGCCPRFSLDYLPHENPSWLVGGESMEMPVVRKVTITFGGESVTREVLSYLQRPNSYRRFCDNVNLETGGCRVHGEQPFSCDFETLRFAHFHDSSWLGVRPYGRGWNMLRVDGERGALCEFPKTQSDVARDEGVRKLQRLKDWTDHFGLQTYLPQVIEWAQSGPHSRVRVWHSVDGEVHSFDN